jgi:thiol:disulfide interchange protein
MSEVDRHTCGWLKSASSLTMKFILVFLTSLFSLYASSQDTTAASWSVTNIKKEGNKDIITIRANIANGWRLFSTRAADDEPNTRFVIDTSSESNYTLNAVVEKGKLVEAKEPLFDGLLIRYYENEAEFEVAVQQSSSPGPFQLSVFYMAMKGDQVTSPVEVPFRLEPGSNGTLVARSATLSVSDSSSNALKRTSIDIKSPDSNCGGTGLGDEQSKSPAIIFLLGFIGGLLALFTPCVFPMIPLTVSFFTKKSGNRSKGIGNAVLYGLFIFLIYVALSIPFHFVDSSNPEILNNISTNVWLNLFFFIIFLVFALSFFGLFEISLPSGLANRVDSKSGTGGVAGIFFMALTLALVSFSCTGPILGSLLAGSLATDGSALQLTMGMAGFGLALALPFAVFALFPGLLSSLPKSGGWLTSVKIVLGFVELALALKFLSNADLVEHWGLLKREVFFGIWIAIGLALSLYLFGILRFPQEAKARPGRLRIVFGIASLAFTIYLVPGVTNTKYANRALVSGFPPPLTYSIYGKDAFKGVEADVINDYQKALALARESGKPLLIDFTGWACVNCRKMEENVWTIPEVAETIENNFVLVSLYVDDRAKLPAHEQFVHVFPDGSKKQIKTIGDKYATFQNINFTSVSQPLYAIVSPDEKLLTKPVGYTPDEEEYLAWLRCGIKKADRR